MITKILQFRVYIALWESCLSVLNNELLNAEGLYLEKVRVDFIICFLKNNKQTTTIWLNHIARKFVALEFTYDWSLLIIFFYAKFLL